MNKSLDSHIDDLLSNLVLPTDEEIKLETRGKLAGRIGGKVSGKMNVESGHLQKIASKGGKGNSSAEMKRKNSLRKHNGHSPGTPINVYDFKTNEFIKEYPSISECCRILKLDKKSTWSVLQGINKQHKGYVFKYKDSTQ